MNYSTYWSILDAPAKSIQSNTVCLCIAIGAAILWFLAKKFKKDKGDGDRAIVLWTTGAFTVFGLAGYITLTFFYEDKSNEKTSEMLNAPETRKVEGIVSGFERTFRKARYFDETIEKFTVDTVKFAYGDAPESKFGSFAETYNHVIFDGQRVRITYKAGSWYGDDCNSILKLETIR